MATANYTRSRTPNYARRKLNDDFENTSLDNYRRQDTRKKDFNQYSTDDRENQTFQCCFCKDFCSSSKALSDHLMLCGNKTDECPKCHKFIRRAIFAYHYENNCANLDETEPSTPRSRKTSARPHSSIPIRPNSHQNDASHYEQEDDTGYNSSNTRHRILNEVLPLNLNKKSSINTTQAKSSQDRHEDNDPKRNEHENSIYSDQHSQKVSQMPIENKLYLSSKEQPTEKDTFYIPCEWCNQPIESNHLLAHNEHCREKEKETRRIAVLAQAINQEPFVEKIPCEYCNELLPTSQLLFHERSCPRNPEYRIQTEMPMNQRTSLTATPRKESDKIHGLSTRSSSSYKTYSSFQPTPTTAYNRSLYSEDVVDQSDDQTSTNRLNNQHTPSHVHISMNRTNNVTTPDDHRRSSIDTQGTLTPRERRRTRNLDTRLINSSNDTERDDNLSTLTTKNRSSNISLLEHASNLRTSHSKYSKSSEALSSPKPRPSSVSTHYFDARGSSHASARKHIPVRSNDINSFFNDTLAKDQTYQPKILSNKRPTSQNLRQPWR